jgi:hypothetical protein
VQPGSTLALGDKGDEEKEALKVVPPPAGSGRRLEGAVRGALLLAVILIGLGVHLPGGFDRKRQAWQKATPGQHKATKAMFCPPWPGFLLC